MVEQAARTFICSVVFVDLVEFSRKSNAEQVLVKETCNALAAEALEPIAPEDRIVIDTGDGFAITFLGDPEDALLVGLKLRDGIEEAMSNHSVGIGRGTANGHVRIGINLGPVKLGTNFNGHVNIVGDGINVAERIMGFALPGQMLVSRSFHDMVSRLEEEYGSLLRFDGTRTDNNARVHALYVAGKGDAALKVAEARALKRRASATTTTRVIAPPAAEAATPAAPAALRPFTADSPPPHLAPLAPRKDGAANSSGSWLHDRFKVGFAAVLLLLAAGFQSSLLVQKWRAPTAPAAVASSTPVTTSPAVPAEEPAKTDPPPAKLATPLPGPGASNPAATTPVTAAPATPLAPPTAPLKAPPKSSPAPAPEPAAKQVESPAKTAPRASTPSTGAAAPTAVAPDPAKPGPRANSAAASPTTSTPAAPDPARNPPLPVGRPGNAERKVEPAREEKLPAKRPVAPQGLQLPAPTVAAPAAAGSKAPAAATPPVDAAAVPVAPVPRPAAPAPAAVVKRSGTIPEFPREAAREGLTRGSVRAKVFIDGAGNVKDIQIVESRPSRVFDRAVRRALMEWKFNTGADNRVYEAEIDFKRDN